MFILSPSYHLVLEYRRKERLELKLAVCKEKIRVLEEQERPKYPRMPKQREKGGEIGSAD